MRNQQPNNLWGNGVRDEVLQQKGSVTKLVTSAAGKGGSEP